MTNAYQAKTHQEALFFYFKDMYHLSVPPKHIYLYDIVDDEYVISEERINRNCMVSQTNIGGTIILILPSAVFLCEMISSYYNDPFKENYVFKITEIKMR